MQSAGATGIQITFTPHSINNTMKDELLPDPVWTVTESHTSGSDAGGMPKVTITVRLMAGGRCHHELRGPTAAKTMQDYADKLNAKNAPIPPRPTRTRADGWKQVDKDATNVVPREIFDHIVQ